MRETISTSYIFNDAAKAGAALGLVSIAYMFASQIFSTIGGDSVALAFILNILVLFLWGLKFWACIYLMKMFMKKLVATYDGVTNAHTFKFGVLSALFSALLFSAMSMANIVLFSSDVYQDQLDTLMSQYAAVLDSNTMSAMTSVAENFGSITFFSTLIYCFLFGTVLSLILSRNIPSEDPFADFNDKNSSAE